MLGDEIPPDELNRAVNQGLHFGFPYCHAGDIPDPEFGSGKHCEDFTPPVQKLGPHVAPLGLRFYKGEMFPADYKGQIFIAEHGSWNRSKKSGYRLSLVRLEDGEAVSYEVFAEGWLQGESVSGRPVDVLELDDGSLLVSDDHAGKIYRISYAG
jgi:glucose/arabinose dehydrogenase